MSTTDPSAFPFGVALDPIQLRVLGSLIEKEIATPEQYPLSLNSLVNACNQRSSRDPVMDLAESEVRDALETLEAHTLVYLLRDTRVTKYEHRARTVLNLRRDETAILCLLLLRGAQTPGELRSRADRLYAFDDLAAVQTTLERLASRAPAEGAAVQNPLHTRPLIQLLPRQPGSREARSVHLLGEPPARQTHDGAEGLRGAAPGSIADRMEQMEAEMTLLKNQIGTLVERIQQLEGERVPSLR